MHVQQVIPLKKRLYTFLLIALPIVDQYASPVPGVPLGDFFLLPFAFLILVGIGGVKVGKSVTSPLTAYLIWIVFGGCISALFQIDFNTSKFVTGTLRLAFYVFLVLIGRTLLFDFDYGLKIYKLITWLATIYIMIQTVAYEIFHLVLPWHISAIPLYSESTYSQVDFASFFSVFYRPYSFFLEPGYYAQYVIPMFIFSLLGTSPSKNKSFLTAIFLTVGLIISTSGQGILMCGFIWAIWGLRKLVVDRSKTNIAVVVSMGLISVLMLQVLFASQRFQVSIHRLFGSPQASAQGRIFQGFAWFSSLNLKFKVIGIGYDNLASVLMNNGLITNNLEAYANSVSYSLLCTGLVGFSILLFFFVKLFGHTQFGFRYIAISMFILCFASGIFNGSTMVLYLTIILCGYRRRNGNVLEKTHPIRTSKVYGSV